MAIEKNPGVIIAGKYRLDKKLGEGGMGEVWKGFHVVLEREVAIKFLLPEIAKDKEAYQRFILEAKAVSKVKHPGVVEIYDMDITEDGEPYIVMEYLEGKELVELIKEQKQLDEEQICNIMIQVAQCLIEVHKQGIIHRDLKPENIFLLNDGGIKILDFGIARVKSQAKRITKTGRLIGTPYYMSPEQVKGMEVDERSDIYSLGVIMYEMFTGKVPFEGETVHEIIAKILSFKYTPINKIRNEVKGGLDKVIEKAMAQDKEERFQNCTELVDALKSVLHKLEKKQGEDRLQETISDRSRRNKIFLIGGTAFLILLIISGITITWLSPGDIKMQNRKITVTSRNYRSDQKESLKTALIINNKSKNTHKIAQIHGKESNNIIARKERSLQSKASISIRKEDDKKYTVKENIEKDKNNNALV